MKLFRILSILAFFSIAQTAFSIEEISKAETLKNADETLSIFVENDIFFSDRYYTNGLKLLYTTEGEDFLTSKLQFAILKLLTTEKRQSYQSLSLGQNMYVPSTITNPNPDPNDRPYAGWLYFGAASHLVSQNRLDSLSISLGVVGPLSLAEDTQKFYHEIINTDRPLGWHEQIKNEPTIEISYNHAERIFKKNLTSEYQTDFIANAGVDLGNFQTQGRIGSLWRFGFNLPDSFSANRIEHSSCADVEWKSSTPRTDWHFFMYCGGNIRFVAYDITLDGNTFEHSRSITPKWLVGELLAGISSRYKNCKLDLNWTLSSSEYRHQKHSPHIFWTLRATFEF